MIKINLLSEGRRPVVARRAKASLSFGGKDPNNVLLIGGLVLGALVAGAWWYRLNSELTQKQREVRAAQARYEELRPIIEQVEEFKRKSQDLENKVRVIKELKAKQKGPVQIMDAVSSALPELLWLDDMAVTGQVVTLRGQAFNTNAVASFIENLTLVPEFEEPDPKNIQITGRGGEDIYTFQLAFSFQLPEIEEGQDEAAPAEGEAPRAG